VAPARYIRLDTSKIFADNRALLAPEERIILPAAIAFLSIRPRWPGFACVPRRCAARHPRLRTGKRKSETLPIASEDHPVMNQ
jgi:hypothetical protein